jgi:small subunit ribosomal protein S1
VNTENTTPDAPEEMPAQTEPVQQEASPREEAVPEALPAGPEPGIFWQAKVSEIGQEYVRVELGDDVVGRFEACEARAADKSLMVAVGDDVEVLLDDLEGEEWVVSMEKAEKLRVFQRLGALAKDKTVISGVITRQVRGGLSVDIGVRAFLPGRESGFRSHEAGAMVGREINCQIQRFDRKKGEVVLTRRKLAEEAVKARKSALYETINVGDVVTGVVSSVTKFGAFLDIGGADGLLHVSEMSWERVGNPSKVVSEGDEIEVQIVEINPDRDRIGLSRKALLENPWQNFADANPAGTKLTGKVKNITDFGAFVEIGAGVEGLVHISELSWDKSVKSANDLLEAGQELEVIVKEVDIASQRVSLSVKRLQPNPWEMALKDLEVGARITGKVSSVVEFGVFVEVIPGVEGLVHVSDMSWTERISNPTDLRDFQEGEELEVMVLSIDSDRNRLSLGIKQLEKEPWELAGEGLRKGGTLEVTISRLVDFGAFATIVPGLEGLIHISELAVDRVERVDEAVKTGQVVKVRVLDADRKKAKISLSIKAHLTGEGEGMREYTEESNVGTSLGALLMKKGLVDEEEESVAASEESVEASEESVEASEESAEASEESAEASEESAETSEESAETSEESAEASEESAETSEESAETSEESAETSEESAE